MRGAKFSYWGKSYRQDGSPFAKGLDGRVCDDELLF